MKPTRYYSDIDGAHQFLRSAGLELKAFEASAHRRLMGEAEACATARAELKAASEALNRARAALIGYLSEYPE
jgi:hypothetical protein